MPAHDDPTDPAARAAGLRRLGALPVLVWAALDAAGVDALGTTCTGGVSAGPYATCNLGLHVGDDPGAVIENRRRAAGALGAGLDDLVFAQQVHGTGVAVVTAAERGQGARREGDAVAATDVLVTAEPGPVLVTLVADCVPLVLVDPAARVLATVHAGWRGTVAGVVGRALEAMAALGARPDRTVAAIGPAVATADYLVGPEVVAAVVGSLGDDAASVLTPGPRDRTFLDLRGANRLQLEAAGVAAGAIHAAPFSTGDGLFYSDRALRPCGRFGVLARLR